MSGKLGARQLDSSDRWTLLLMEECAEVQQICSKILRFGIGSNYKGKTNKELLEFELKDVVVCMKELMDCGYLDTESFEPYEIEKHMQQKRKRMEARNESI